MRKVTRVNGEAAPSTARVEAPVIEMMTPRGSATIDDVALAAGVSRATVSRALNGGSTSASTRTRVLGIADSLGYRPSYIGRALSTRRAGAVLALVSRLDRHSAAEELRGLVHEFSPTGTGVTLVELPGDDSPQAGGLLADRGRFDAVALLDSLAARHLPASIDDDRPAARIGEDEISGRWDPVATALDHLARRGHIRIGFVAVDAAATAHTWCDAHRVARFSALHPGGPLAPADPGVEGGYAATADLLESRHRPSALIAGSGELAIGAAVAAARLGLRIPEDLSLLALEDHPLAELHGITAIDVRSHQRGRLAAQRILDLLQPELPRRGVRRPALDPDEASPRIRLRTSTAAPAVSGAPAAP